MIHSDSENNGHNRYLGIKYGNAKNMVLFVAVYVNMSCEWK